MRTCLAALALAMSFTVMADPPTQVMNIYREGELKFMPSKLVPGVSQAVIWGNPAKPGDEEAVVQIMGVGPSATIRVDETGRPKDN